MTRPARRPRGLTLIEIIVVIAIISMLMGAVSVFAIGTQREAQRKTAKLDVRTAANALDMYRANVGRYPDPMHGFQPLVEKRVLKVAPPKDPWGNALTWSLHEGEAMVVCYGADGRPGGENDDADITSLELE